MSISFSTARARSLSVARMEAPLPNRKPQPNIFGPVLLAILIAAAIIWAVVAIKVQIKDSEEAETAFHQQMAHTDAYLAALKSVYGSPSPGPMVPAAASAPHKNYVTLTVPAAISTPRGIVTLQKGTRLPFVGWGADKVRIQYYDGVAYEIPISVTDLR